jgi:septum site-determining protein MinD
MTQVLAVNAFRRGTGTTHVAANLAALFAEAGQRVGLIDADLQGPSQHFLFNVEPEQMSGSLKDFLLGESALQATTINLSGANPSSEPLGILIPPDSGQNGIAQSSPDPIRIYFVPSTSDSFQPTKRSLFDGDFGRLSDGIQALSSQLALDILILDTPAGIGEETLQMLALCDRLFVVLTLDHREVQGSSITIDVAPKLNVSQTQVVVNKAPADYDRISVRRQISEGYGCDVAAILPYSDEIAALESRALFAQRYPQHAATWAIRRLAQSILAGV